MGPRIKARPVSVPACAATLTCHECGSSSHQGMVGVSVREPPVSRFISRATPQASGDAPAEPRAVVDRAPVQRTAGAQQPREMDAALFNLSEPAHPRDASPAETASFVPASHVSAYAQQPEAAPVLDDFDRLIASEMAAMGTGASPAQGASPALSLIHI